MPGRRDMDVERLDSMSKGMLHDLLAILLLGDYFAIEAFKSLQDWTGFRHLPNFRFPASPLSC